MRLLILGAVVGVMAAAAPNLGAVHAQLQSQQPTTANTHTSGLPAVDGRDGPESNDPYVAMRRAQMARMATTERQKKIAEDTAKLLTLATELKEDVDKTNKNEMSLEVIRKADEIERLAHDVKQRMKG